MDKDSNIYIQLFSKHSKYIDSIKNINNPQFINIINTLYSNFLDGYVWSNNIFNQKNIQINSHKNDNQYLYNSKYVNSNIQAYVEKNIKYDMTYTFKINYRNIILNISTQKKHSYAQYSKWIKQIMAWIYVAQIYSEKKCGINLNINIIMTNLKKCMPQNNKVIGVNNVNSGLSSACARDSIILIYRKEEWFKVLIHEIFHNFGLDFSHRNHKSYNKILNEYLRIKNNILLFETYTEFWARIINCINNAIVLNKYGTNFNDFFEYFYILLHFERVLSMYQSTKILEYQNMSYEDIFKYNNYDENSNVFAYYIGVAILMNNLVDSVLHQNDNIFSLKLKNIELFYNFFINKTKSRETINNFNNIYPLIKKINIKTNRMSLSLQI